MYTRDAIKFFGSQKILTEKLGVCRQAIYQWGEVVPWRRALQLEKLSGGKLPIRKNHYVNGERP